MSDEPGWLCVLADALNPPTDPTPRDPVRDLLARAVHEADGSRYPETSARFADILLATPSGKALAARVAAADESRAALEVVAAALAFVMSDGWDTFTPQSDNAARDLERALDAFKVAHPPSVAGEAS